MVSWAESHDFDYPECFAVLDVVEDFSQDIALPANRRDDCLSIPYRSSIPHDGSLLISNTLLTFLMHDQRLPI